MRDNTLFIFLRETLLALLPMRGVDVEVKQSYQPTQQGRPGKSAVFLHKIMDKRHGSRGIIERFDEAKGKMVRVESQAIETTIQFNALAAERNPADDEEYTAADILKAVAAVLQSREFLDVGRAAGVFALRIQDMRNQTFENERDRFEFEPSFDAVFVHTDIFEQPINHLTRIDKPPRNRGLFLLENPNEYRYFRLRP